MTHETVTIEIGGNKVDVDKKLAALILEMNKVGITTNACCQGGTETFPDYPNVPFAAHLEIELNDNTRAIFTKNKLILYWKTEDNQNW